MWVDVLPGYGKARIILYDILVLEIGLDGMTNLLYRFAQCKIFKNTLQALYYIQMHEVKYNNTIFARYF